MAQTKHNQSVKLHVRKGDRVTIYLPMIVDAVVAMLACARIGAVHWWCSAASHRNRSPTASPTAAAS